MSTTNKAPEALLAKIRQGNRFLLTSHINPDGDAICSALGLARVLRGLGKGAVVWLRDPIPRIYESFPGSDRIHQGEEPPAGWPDKFDAVVVLECPSLERSGLHEHLGDLPILNIDHHLGNQHYGQVNWVDTAAPAVGEMVYRLAKGLNVSIDADTANALYTTIVTDTGGFRFSNTTVAAFESCASLLEEGAQPEQVSGWLYENQPIAGLRLLSELLQTLELHEDGRIASVYLTQEMFQRAGADAGDAEGLVDYPRSIAGVEAVALLREREDGKTKISLRSRGEADVQKVAQRHGGGGHKNAAGFEIDGTPEAVREQVVGALAEVLQSR
jgi:phosphoesterase RecJ-like protein